VNDNIALEIQFGDSSTNRGIKTNFTIIALIILIVIILALIDLAYVRRRKAMREVESKKKDSISEEPGVDIKDEELSTEIEDISQLTDAQPPVLEPVLEVPRIPVPVPIPEPAEIPQLPSAIEEKRNRGIEAETEAEILPSPEPQAPSPESQRQSSEAEAEIPPNPEPPAPSLGSQRQSSDTEAEIPPSPEPPTPSPGHLEADKEEEE
jgi:hypothetical protein